MNERIRELIEQCYEKHELLDTYEFNKEKFAELIVRECAKVCRNQSNEYAMELDRENCASAIEEHFGVEEPEDSACPLCGEDGGTTCGMPGCQY